MSNPTMITAKPHPSLEAAVRYATALSDYNAGAIRFMERLRELAPNLTPFERNEFAEALEEYRYAHRDPNKSVTVARSAVLELASGKGISVDTDGEFYAMLYFFSFSTGVLARAEKEALAERNPFGS